MRRAQNNTIKIIATVIPCYKVRTHILTLINRIGPEVTLIYVIDDCCPEGSGNYVANNTHDSRVKIIYNKENLGVGGAVMAGYQAAIHDGATIIIKLDGDGQMDPRLIPLIIAPIISGVADYTKGNRFFDLEEIRNMPTVRLFGNTVLSFMTKLSSGYWDIFDPTNGYTAIHTDVARSLPFKKISQRYFFESDILFRLNTLRAVVIDVPMPAKYADEISNLKISKIIGEFILKHVKNFMKRIFYNYYLRNLSLASLELPLGLLLFVFGICFGCYHWITALHKETITPTGTVMLAVLPIVLGLQFILAFLGYDISSVPRKPLHILRQGVKFLEQHEQ